MTDNPHGYDPNPQPTSEPPPVAYPTGGMTNAAPRNPRERVVAVTTAVASIFRSLIKQPARRLFLAAAAVLSVVAIIAISVAVGGRADDTGDAKSSQVTLGNPCTAPNRYDVTPGGIPVYCAERGGRLNWAVTPTPKAPPTPSASPTATSAQRTLEIDCVLATATGYRVAFEVVVDPAKGADFAELWAAKATSCDADVAIWPETPLEQAALKTSKYDDGTITTLYTMCAAVDPEDTYASAGFAAGSAQIPEINAALMLCPKHPQAGKWRQAVQRGQVDVNLEKSGRLFGAGTFLVGKEIKAGTYVATDVEGCYWERQNRSGGTIDNYFTNAAKRVQVTIKSSDYAFHSESCGEWRPR